MRPPVVPLGVERIQQGRRLPLPHHFIVSFDPPPFLQHLDRLLQGKRLLLAIAPRSIPAESEIPRKNLSIASSRYSNASGHVFGRTGLGGAYVQTTPPLAEARHWGQGSRPLHLVFLFLQTCKRRNMEERVDQVISLTASSSERVGLTSHARTTLELDALAFIFPSSLPLSGGPSLLELTHSSGSGSSVIFEERWKGEPGAARRPSCPARRLRQISEITITDTRCHASNLKMQDRWQVGQGSTFNFCHIFRGHNRNFGELQEQRQGGGSTVGQTQDEN